MRIFVLILSLSSIEYILKNVNNETVEDVDFHSTEKILWKLMATINCLVTNILRNIFFCVQQKKETHTGLNQLEYS